MYSGAPRDGDEDAELLRVLEISRLEEEDRQRKLKKITKKPEEIIEINDSDEEVTLQELKRHNSKGKGKQPERSTRPSSQPTPPPNQGVSLFLAERAKLERERLARQKRLRPDIEQEEDESSEEKDEPPSKRPRPTVSAQAAVNASSSRLPPTSASGEPMYWEGEIRQTANRHALPSKDTKPVFRLTEILGNKPHEIKLVIMAAYCVDPDWLLRILPQNTPIILIAQPAPDGNATVHNILPNWVRTTPFLRAGRGCMHMKFMLVFYSTGRLRVMISTANLIDYDWRDIENTAWVQDIPLRRESIPHDSDADDFPAQFQHVLSKLHFNPALQSHLRGDHPQLPLRSINELRTRWDWSKVKVRLVVSIAGKFEGRKEVSRSGHTMLAKAIRDLGAACPEDKELNMECQGSSIGTYSASWMNEIYASAKGIPLERWFSFKASQGRGKLIMPSTIKILFPSLSTVDRSALGREGGGTMFCREQQWSGKTFPRQLFHDSKSKRGGILMHSKMILGVFKEKTQPSSSRKASSKDKARSDVGGWCYIGRVFFDVQSHLSILLTQHNRSHNFTPSAWGTLSGSASEPVMNVTNYEMGILVPLPLGGADAAGSDLACWERPPPKYRLGTDEPWMQDKHMPK